MARQDIRGEDQVNIVTREQWGAIPQARLEPTVWSNGLIMVVHHTAGPAPSGHLEQRSEEALMRGFDRQHYYVNGWSGGIGYNFVVFPSGRVYEGRGEAIGAHAPGANHLPGVAFVGHYGERLPSNKAWRACETLAAALGVVTFKGHRDYYRTACPGWKLYQGLEAMRAYDWDFSSLRRWPPHGRTLRLSLRDGEFTRAGWAQVEHPLRNIAKKGLDPNRRHAIAWRGHVWRGAKDVTNVAKHLVTKFLED